jgi:predicted dehydrogenase
VFREARSLAGQLGRVIKIDLVADMPMNVGNKYFGSPWRRDTDTCPGGFVMDLSVHFVAALRTLARGAGASGWLAG